MRLYPMRVERRGVVISSDSSTPEFKSAQMHELVKKAMYADVARKLVTKDNTLAALENSEGVSLKLLHSTL